MQFQILLGCTVSSYFVQGYLLVDIYQLEARLRVCSFSIQRFQREAMLPRVYLSAKEWSNVAVSEKPMNYQVHHLPLSPLSRKLTRIQSNKKKYQLNYAQENFFAMLESAVYIVNKFIMWPILFKTFNTSFTQ